MPDRKRVLIVEDDARVREVVLRGFEAEGYQCRCAASGDGVLDAVRDDPPDLIVMDRVLPDVSGDELVRRLRADEKIAAIPVIMLSGKSEESDELVGLALGADDYIAKPFSLKRLVARAEVVLRRAPRAAEGEFPPRLFMLDRQRRTLRIDDRVVSLSLAEYRMLGALMAAGGRLIPRPQLFQIACDSGGAVGGESLDDLLGGLRRKLGAAAALVLEVGDGLAFFVPPPPPAATGDK